MTGGNVKSDCHAIVLMNLGSPDSTEVSDVKKYLREFLMDERVIDYPYLFRWLLINGIIAPFRAPKSAEAYKAVWTKEGSPLIVLSEALRDAVSERVDVPVRIMMRYGNPSPAQVFDELQSSYPQLEKVLLLPLYPHYAMSSYETAVVYAEDILRAGDYSFTMETIKPFFDNKQYINALAKSIQPYLAEPYDQILFSYHGLPERHMRKADITGKHCLSVTDCCNISSPAHKTCYRHQCFRTTQLVAEQLDIPTGKYNQSFQSRLGREEWLKPYTVERLAQLPNEGVKKLLIVCPAFVSDCLETLEEIAIEGREIFLEAGGESFTMIPCMNTQPFWVDTISDWTNQYFAGDRTMIVQ